MTQDELGQVLIVLMVLMAALALLAAILFRGPP